VPVPSTPVPDIVVCVYVPLPITPVPLKVMLGCGAWILPAIVVAAVKPAVAVLLTAVNPEFAILVIPAALVDATAANALAVLVAVSVALFDWATPNAVALLDCVMPRFV
jgi:hypothetical protein